MVPTNQSYTYSIVIPAYNEAYRIEKTIQDILSYIKNSPHTFELIIVNDGSQDDTKKVVQSFIEKQPAISLISYTPNKGKGFAVQQGILASKGMYILFADADNSTPIKEIHTLSAYVDTHDIIIGSRSLKKDYYKPYYRHFLTHISQSLFHLLVKDINDTQCGFKLFRSEVAKDLCSKQKLKRFGFDVELLFIAQRKNYKIKEVPIEWTHHPDTRVHPIKDSFRTLGEIIIILLNFLRGKY